jgi:elongation factor 1-beta
LDSLTKEAEKRVARKESQQRTLLAIGIKPWEVDQDLMILWKKITATISQDGFKWGETCSLAHVAFLMKKIRAPLPWG